MKKLKLPKTLLLNKKTVSMLNDNELSQFEGGGFTYSVSTGANCRSCKSPNGTGCSTTGICTR